jgi:hypothetical protein
MNTLAPPSAPSKSYTAASCLTGFATASAMRPGDGLTITQSGFRQFIEFTFTEPARPDRAEQRIMVSIHRDGIPAVIAELQRLMGEPS